MPDKIIEIPGVGRIAFPDSMTDAQINAAATKLYQEKNPQAKQPPVKSWMDTAVDWLPTVGGVVGGIAGGMAGGPGGAILGATAGGAAGEGYRQTAQAVRGQQNLPPGQAMRQMGQQALIQGGSEAAGAGIAAVGAPILKAGAETLMQTALKPGLKVAVSAVKRGETPRVVKTLLDEGISVTPGGVRKLNRLIDASNQEITDAVASLPVELNPFKVTKKLGSVAQEFSSQTNRGADLRTISDVGNQFLEENPRLTIQDAQRMKVGEHQRLKAAYQSGQPMNEASTAAKMGLTRGLKDEIASEVDQSLAGLRGKLGLPGGINITAANAREGAAIEARDAVAKRVAVAGNRDPMGLASLVVQHPITFLTVLMDRHPGIKSMLARGLYSTAGTMAGVSPLIVRAAVASIASSDDQEGQ